MSANLFVYGTLMPTACSSLGAAERRRLRLASRYIGPATLQGRLYDLGQYPGVVESADPMALVHGALLALDRPDEVLGWLDAYEGIRPGDPDPEYARRICPVRLGGGREETAWVYLYRWPMHRGTLIPGGRWNAA